MMHVKPHGALYQMGARNCTCNCSSSFDFDSNLIFVGLANTLLISEAELVGLKVASEVFADRRYEDDGQLVSRKPMPLSLILTKQSNKH